MIGDCKSGEIDFIVTKSISRFSRNTTDCLEIVRTLLSLNIPIYFEKEDLNTAAMEGELLLSLLSGLAQSESNSMSQNIKWSVQKRYQNGTFKIAYPPYGYNFDGNEMIINESQAKIVKQIFKETLSGNGVATIASALNNENIPTKKKAKWSTTTILGMLRNEKYTGDVIFQKTYSDCNFNRHTNHDEVDKYFMANHHEAIISHDDFDKVQAILIQRGAEKGNIGETQKYLNRYELSGKIICGQCSNTFKRRIHHSIHQNYVAWCCHTHLADKKKCSMLYIKDEAIKNAFIVMINKLIFAHELILSPILENIQNFSDDKRILKIREIEKELLKISEKKEIINKLFAEKYIDFMFFTKENNVFSTEAARLKKEIESLKNSRTSDSLIIKNITDLQSFLQSSDMHTSYDKETFSKFVESVIVYSRNEIGFKLKCGLTLKERI